MLRASRVPFKSLVITVEKLRAYFSLTRGYMSLVVAATALCGVHLSKTVLQHYILAALFAAQVCVVAGCFALNDIVDRTRDADSACKPIPNGRVTLTEARLATAVLLVCGLTIGSSLGARPLALLCVQIVAILFYSGIKRRSGLAANILTAILCASGFLLGSATSGVLGEAWVPAVLTIVLIVPREIVKDVMDQEADQAAGIPTLPILYGMSWVRVIVVLLVSIMVVLSMLPQVRQAFRPGYIIPILLVDTILLAVTAAFAYRPDRHSVSRFLTATAISFPLALMGFFL